MCCSWAKEKIKVTPHYNSVWQIIGCVINGYTLFYSLIGVSYCTVRETSFDRWLHFRRLKDVSEFIADRNNTQRTQHSFNLSFARLLFYTLLLQSFLVAVIKRWLLARCKTLTNNKKYFIHSVVSLRNIVDFFFSKLSNTFILASRFDRTDGCLSSQMKSLSVQNIKTKEREQMIFTF